MNMRFLDTQSRRRGAAARFVAALAVLALALGLALASSEEASAARAKASEVEGQKPSFVVIQTDDETMEELYDGVRMLSGAEEYAMPNTLQLLGEKGVTFSRYYTPYSLCAPSRVSLLTGRYELEYNRNSSHCARDEHFTHHSNSRITRARAVLSGATAAVSSRPLFFLPQSQKHGPRSKRLAAQLT